jgi:adenosylhomocysteine nucleosidase
LIDHMQDAQTINRGMRDYVKGNLWGIECVCVLSRMGKVAAAATAATLIERFGVTHLLFTGVAGAGGDNVKVGDIVIAQQLVQHDLDASPFFPRYEVPLTGQSRFGADKKLTDQLLQATSDFIDHDFHEVTSAADRATFRLDQPRIHHGLIVSGDQFISSRARLEELKTAFPDLLAVEMEGAAVAQVCFEFNVPFAVVRAISDGANEEAPVDFMQFIERVAARYAYGIVRRLCTNGAEI